MAAERLRLEDISADVRTLRRVIYLGLVILMTLLGVFMLFDIYIVDGLSITEAILLPLFLLLFSQIAIGFTLAVIGFFQLLSGGDKLEIMQTLPPLRETGDVRGEMADTAVVLPVYNENISRVLAAVERMLGQLREQGVDEFFDIFLLSDSNQPDSWIHEETAWLEFCKKHNAFGNVFYRKRRVPLKAKSGNVADFCRRWGKGYRYMIVLDADSVMSANCMTRLVRAMETNPRVGIIQTPPVMVLGQTLFRRMFQFVARVCGPLFTTGANFWQMGGGNFWGHNAIIRLAPFMEHCGLPDLPEDERSKRHIMSHDTVEAALMKRAGYDVWLALEENGSYEEGPPTLTDMLTRDRRWCQGNLQHFWFLFARRVDFANRLHIWKGLMSYGSSPLWFLFLVFSAIDASSKSRFYSLAAMQPEEFAGLSLTAVQLLLLFTLALLFVPKLLGYLLALPRAKHFGGVPRLTLSMVLETLFSVLLAPILMIFHTRFVVMILLGRKIRWTPQNRDRESGITWGDAARTYGWVAVLGVVAGFVSWKYLPEYFWWFLPIFGSWILAIPLAWVTSRPGPGLAARRAGLFVIPEETEPPVELRDLEDPAEIPDFWPHPTAGAAGSGLVQAVLNPYVNAIHISLLRQKRGRKPGQNDPSLPRIADRLLAEGPAALNRDEQMKLLWNADLLQDLHQRLWRTPAAQLHESWPRLFDDLVKKSAPPIHEKSPGGQSVLRGGI